MPAENEKTVSAAPTPRLQFIDGLRGIAVLMVVNFHAVVWGGFPVESHFSFYFLNGAIPLELGRLRHIWSVGGGGVDLFLAISGFCLYWPLIRNGGIGVQPLRTWPYLKKRIWRICPPYYFAFATVLLCSYFTYQFEGKSWWPWSPNSFQNAFPWRGLDSWLDVTSHLLLIHGFFNDYVSAYEGAYWSLALEWQFYFLFIPLAFVARRFGAVWAAIVPILVSLLFRSVCLAVMPQFLTSGVGNAFSLNRWAEFGAGMLAATIVSGSIPQRLAEKFAPFKRLRFLYVVASITLALTLEYRGDAPHFLTFAWGNASLAILVSGAQSSMVRRFLGWRPLTWLGSISYSLYLTHGMVYMAMATLLTRNNVEIEPRLWVYLLGGPPLAITFAALFFRCFEKPFLTGRQSSSQAEKIQPSLSSVQDQAAP